MTPRTAPISVLLVDDHAVVREGYRRLLERAEGIEVAGEAASAMEAYQAFRQVDPDVVVMDISLPDVSGIEAMRRLLLRDPRARVLVFSIHDEPVFADRAFRAGARGYVTKASAPDVLVDAVRAVARADTFLSPDIAHGVALRALRGSDDALQSLSDREFEIVRLLAQGRSVREIAELLCLNHKTVANYQWAIRQKLGADTAVELLRIAAANGLTTARPAEDGLELPERQRR
ncbi:MAG TPA: response regulator transcription factor [Casimicrobiaceae bacterium]|nr:response regulator transcription factor [Casimicrobiaceae bacterium]